MKIYCNLCARYKDLTIRCNDNELNNTAFVYLDCSCGNEIAAIEMPSHGKWEFVNAKPSED